MPTRVLLRTEDLPSGERLAFYGEGSIEIIGIVRFPYFYRYRSPIPVTVENFKAPVNLAIPQSALPSPFGQNDEAAG